jgi:hypothetical protein
MHYSGGNESPEIFRYWTGLGVLSTTLKRHVWVPQGQWSVYPNLYVVFVAEAGVAKSTAMRMGTKLLNASNVTPVAPSAITLEALTEQLGDPKKGCQTKFTIADVVHEQSAITVHANELITFLGPEPDRMVSFLTDVWDQPLFKVQTKNKGTDTIVGPSITLLGCLTPSLMTGQLKNSFITGGFSRRCAFVHSSYSAEIHPFPEFTAAQKAARDACVNMLKEINVFARGEFTWETSAREFFVRWYRDNHAQLHSCDDPLRAQFLSTKRELMLKLAMILQVSCHRELLVTEDNLIRANELLTPCERVLSSVLGGSGPNPLAHVSSLVEQKIKKAGPNGIGSSQIELLFHSQANTRDILSVIEHLTRVGKVVVTLGHGGKQVLYSRDYVDSAGKPLPHVVSE